MSVVIVGEITTGAGEAAEFTGLDWVRRAFVDRLGIDPHPGTVNLALRTDEARAQWAALQAGPAVEIPPPDPAWCDARCWHATIAAAADGDRGTIAAAIIRPMVAGYPVDRIELVAAVGVRETLGLADGDAVRIECHAAAEGAERPASGSPGSR